MVVVVTTELVVAVVIVESGVVGVVESGVVVIDESGVVGAVIGLDPTGASTGAELAAVVAGGEEAPEAPSSDAAHATNNGIDAVTASSRPNTITRAT